MTENEALAKMIPPGQRRPGKPRGGVIQIHLTRSCDKTCFNCTQGSNLAGPTTFMSLRQFEQAVLSLKDYWGIVGVFGGNPAIHPKFPEICEILRDNVPFEQRGLWCNNPINSDNARAMRVTFNPAVSNLNVHLDREAYDLFKIYWPESRPFGLHDDSRHSPPYVAMKDVLRKPCPDCEDRDEFERDSLPICPTCDGDGQVYDESLAWDLISNCDINKHWSAMIGVFRGELRAWFCEIAGAQAMLHQYNPEYPDTGIPIGGEYEKRRLESGYIPLWWQYPMSNFFAQVRKHCHECGVPLRGYGELAQQTNPDAKEQVSQTHASIYKPKRRGRAVELITVPSQLGERLDKMTDYLGNAKR